MKDNFGREINYLRVSVTQRCNLNCLYCGSGSPDLAEMTVDEISRFVKAFAQCGINKVRITGGEPLLRTDIVEIVSALSEIQGIEKLVLTTNGVYLKKYAGDLKKAGLSAVNISIDALDREKYKLLTGRDCLPQVLESIDEAERAELKIRVNAVLIKGQNDDQAGSLIELAKDRKIDVRFIELMPFSDTGKNEKMIVKGNEILERFPFLKPVQSKKTGFEQSVARYYEAVGFRGRIGLITPVSDKFCDNCNRIRLLSDGKVRLCLGHDDVIDLRRCSDDNLLEVVKAAIMSKPKGHEFNCGYANSHAMNKIGG
ncbi:MAG: GTP 3',8-cyclase MoaA [Clostridiales bacterium]|nr:GTP 3',8-cyclase MoaA [Clostridiales bacterium]